MAEEHVTNNSEAVNGGGDSSLRILVVDDSATIRRSAESMLTSAG
jgi:PleD family two-component response regulator